jgi:hypothetical protein
VSRFVEFCRRKEAESTPSVGQGAVVHVTHFLERRHGAKSAKFAKGLFCWFGVAHGFI